MDVRCFFFRGAPKNTSRREVFFGREIKNTSRQFSSESLGECEKKTPHVGWRQRPRKKKHLTSAAAGAAKKKHLTSLSGVQKKCGAERRQVKGKFGASQARQGKKTKVKEGKRRAAGAQRPKRRAAGAQMPKWRAADARRQKIARCRRATGYPA